jgi:hypothetical protein
MNWEGIMVCDTPSTEKLKRGKPGVGQFVRTTEVHGSTTEKRFA